MEYIFILVISVVVSSFGTLIGFGGGVFMVPILVLVFNVPINVAVGSVILALLPSSLISTYFNVKNHTIDYFAGIHLEVPTIFGTVLGSLFTAIIPVRISEIIFSVFIILLAVYTNFNKANSESTHKKKSFFNRLNNIGPGISRTTNYGSYRISVLLAIVFGMMAGILAGFFGIGGGFLKVPILLNVFGLPPITASATALFMIVFTSFTGSVSHYYLGQIHFIFSLPIIFGFIIGSSTTKFISPKISQNLLKKLIALGLFLAGISMLVFRYFYN